MPMACKITKKTSSMFEMSWAKSTDNVKVLGYVVKVIEDGTTDTSVINYLPYMSIGDIGGLKVGTAYHIYLSAYDNSFNYGGVAYLINTTLSY